VTTGWTEVRLGDLALKMQDGPFGSNLKSAHYVDRGVRVVRLQNIGIGRFLDADSAYISDDHFDALRKHECLPGDVLIATLGDPILRACVLPATIPVALNKADCLQLRCDRARLLPEYLVGFLNSPTGQQLVAGLAHGQTRLRINLNQLRAIPILLPPIEEQRRIATILDRANNLRASRRTSIVAVDALAYSIFAHMFGGSAQSLTEHPLVPLKEVAEIQGGLQVTSKRKSNPIEVPYLRVANVHRGSLDLSEVKTIRVTNGELRRSSLIDGDLLVVEGHGNKAEIGRVAIWDGSIRPCVHQNHLIRVRCDPAFMYPRLAEVYLNSFIGRRELLRAANTTSGLNTISTADVSAARVPVVPLKDQESFVSAASTVDGLRRKLMLSLASLDCLFASLQHRAFRGEL
jgi:type I restriction enzyme S subunit